MKHEKPKSFFSNLKERQLQLQLIPLLRLLNHQWHAFHVGKLLQVSFCPAKVDRATKVY